MLGRRNERPFIGPFRKLSKIGQMEHECMQIPQLPRTPLFLKLAAMQKNRKKSWTVGSYVNIFCKHNFRECMIEKHAICLPTYLPYTYCLLTLYTTFLCRTQSLILRQQQQKKLSFHTQKNTADFAPHTWFRFIQILTLFLDDISSTARVLYTPKKKKKNGERQGNRLVQRQNLYWSGVCFCIIYGRGQSEESEFHIAKHFP